MKQRVFLYHPRMKHKTVSFDFRKDVSEKLMGALNSSVRKESRPDWIAPTSTRKGDNVRRSRLTSLMHNKCFTEKLANFRWRRKVIRFPHQNCS